MTTTFSDLLIGECFKYENDSFIKTDTGHAFIPPIPKGGVAWSTDSNKVLRKQWAFIGDEQIERLV